MKDLERIIYITIIIAIFIFSATKEPEIKIRTIPGDSVFTTIIKDSLIVDTFEIYNKDTLWMYDTIVNPGDTVFVYNEFFKMNKYNDTIQDDSSMTIIRDLWITQNKTYKENYYTKNNRQISIVYNNCPTSFITIGGSINKYSFPIMVGYEKNSNEFSVGLDIFNNYSPTIGYERKFKLR